MNSNVERMLARSLATGFGAFEVTNLLRTDAEMREGLSASDTAELIRRLAGVLAARRSGSGSGLGRVPRLLMNQMKSAKVTATSTIIAPNRSRVLARIDSLSIRTFDVDRRALPPLGERLLPDDDVAAADLA